MLLLMVMMVTAAAMMLMLMVMLMGFFQFFQLCSQGRLAFHSGNQLLAGQITPGSGDDGSLLIMLPQQGNCCIQLCLGNRIGTGENNGRCGFDLVIVELTKVLHIDLYLACIHHSHGVAQGDFIGGDLLYSTNNIRQLAHAGGFDDDTVRIVLLDHLGQCLTEVSHKRAADAAGVHFSDIDACILQEAAINTNFTEFIFDENQFLTLIGLLDHFLDKGGLACTQKTGIDINFHK